jgi:predicted nucleic acid-binding protein
VATVAERVLLDTNVLLAATDEGRAEHGAALAALNEWPRSGTVLYTSAQIIREYLVVATRPVERNGLGLATSEAVSNVRALRGRLRLLGEDTKVVERLQELIGSVPCAGKQIHDANLVATMLQQGIETLVTINVQDFERFGPWVAVVRLNARLAR